MLIDVHPEPTPEEREALLEALAGIDGAPAPASAWWEAGIREAVDGEAEEL
jgi:hypothetical protein